MQLRKCYAIIACVLIVACLVVTLATIGQVEAKSRVPTVTLTIKMGPNNHQYCSPTSPACVNNLSLTLKIVNNTKVTAHLLLNNGTKGNTYTVKGGKTLTLAETFQYPINNYWYEIFVYILQNVNAPVSVMPCPSLAVVC